MTLYLLGLGLGSLEYLTLGVVKEIENCDEVYLDSYTGFISKELREWLEKKIGGKLVMASRRDLEDNLLEIINKAKDRNVGVLVQGDPLIATTHISLVIEAVKRGVSYKIIHGVSAYSAAPSIAGLQVYRFGKTTTLATEGDSKETYRVIQENLERGLHTLVLLDTFGGGLTIDRALKKLLDVEESLGRGIVREDTLVVALAGIGTDREFIKAGVVKELIELDYPPPPHMMIIVGELHFMEAEALIRLHNIREELVKKHKPPRYEKDRTFKYIVKTRSVLESLEIKDSDKNVERVIELANSYLEDATIYWSSGELYNALASIAYAEGLLDSLRIIGKVHFEWP
ncbi:MAG: diphthine synthase [Aigarchaeota archaeon]|nr:diphthine synthase [Aigarchaeota archaeon]MCX8193435.1 diphthine synthase [Nitrososphaeria archaeon]MDW7985833.1 diphthine synthase [Nitrososphaerota archaeon]